MPPFQGMSSARVGDSSELGKTGNHKIFVGSIPNNITSKELISIFTSKLPGVSVKDCWISPGNSFAFLLLDTRYNVVRACHELDGTEFMGRLLRVRPAFKNTAVKVHDIPAECGNVMLMRAFSIFGDVERATVATDEKGNSLGWGLVEFARKVGMTRCAAECQEKPFLIGKDAVPVRVEIPIQEDLDVGLSDSEMARHRLPTDGDNMPEPRFPKDGPPGSTDNLEYNLSLAWKEMADRSLDRISDQARQARRDVPR